VQKESFKIFLFSLMVWFGGPPVFCQSRDYEFSAGRERIYEGEKIKIEFNSSFPLKGDAQAVASVTLLGKVIGLQKEPYQKSLSFQFASLAHLRAPVPCRVKLDLERSSDSSPIFSTSSVRFVFPLPGSSYIDSKTFQNVKILVYDPHRLIVSELTYLGIPFDSVQNFDKVDLLKWDVFVFGPNSMDQRANQAVPKILSAVENKGARVIVFEQNEMSEFNRSLEVGYEEESVLISSITFSGIRFPTEIRSPSSWGYSEACATQLIKTKPSQGYTTQAALHEYDPKKTQDRGDSEEEALFNEYLIVGIPFGRGTVLLNQLDLSDHFRDEPLARWIFAELLKIIAKKS
jgi:hypothetical protein